MSVTSPADFLIFMLPQVVNTLMQSWHRLRNERFTKRMGGNYIDISDDVRRLLAEKYPLILEWLDKDKSSSLWDALSCFDKVCLDDYYRGMPVSASEMVSSQTIAGLVLQLKAFKNDAAILQDPTLNIIAEEVRFFDTACRRNDAWMYPEELYTANQVGLVLDDAIQWYVKAPYCFLRENDLVTYLVGALQKAFDGERTLENMKPNPEWGIVAKAAKKEKRAGKFERVVPSPDPRTSRVRTEIKVGHEPQPNDNLEAQKIDICVLKNTDVDIYHHGSGVRDVVLQVTGSQIAPLIEVKLYPITFSRQPSTSAKKSEKCGHGWIDDLWELKKQMRALTLNEPGEMKQRSHDPVSAHLVFIDTAVYLDGMLYKQRDPSKPLPGLLSTTNWPFPTKTFSIEVPFGEARQRKTIKFQYEDPNKINVSSKDETHLFLHGLGRGDDEKIKSCCWRVRFEN